MDRDIDKIRKYKKTHKNHVLQRVINSMITAETVIMPHYGQTEIIAYEFVNPLKYEGVFAIKINDPDEKFIGKSELQLIKKTKQWKYLVKTRGYKPPPEYGFITDENVFVLGPDQSCTFLFKYKSLRKYMEKESKEDQEFKVKPYEKKFYKKFNRDRDIRVIFHQKGRQIVCGMKVEVQVIPTFFDHSFKQYEQESTLCHINLPSLYYETKYDEGH